MKYVNLVPMLNFYYLKSYEFGDYLGRMLRSLVALYLSNV
jgi:hypothetical protein